jgi:hypothetical protein
LFCLAGASPIGRPNVRPAKIFAKGGMSLASYTTEKRRID